MRQSWQTITRRVLLDAPPWLTVQQEQVRLPNGVEIPDYYTIQMPEWAQVVAVMPDTTVLMVEHYKHGAGVVSLEMPAGYLDPDEDPLRAAQREFREETGCEAGQWRALGRYFVDGNRGCGASHIFLARDVRQVGPPVYEDTELITLHRVPLADLRAMLLAGRFSNVGTVAALGLALAALGDDEGEQV